MSEFAPQYTFSEKVRILLKHLAWALPLFLVLKLWLFPWLNQSSEMAVCYHYGPLNGLEWMIYGVFIALPLSLVVLMILLEGKHSFEVYKTGQHPLPGEKTLIPTRYVYGLKAKMRPFGLVIMVVLATGLSVKGYFWANEMLSMVDPAKIDCSGIQHLHHTQ